MNGFPFADHSVQNFLIFLCCNMTAVNAGNRKLEFSQYEINRDKILVFMEIAIKCMAAANEFYL